MVYSGALVATIEEDHIKVTVLIDRFQERGKKLFKILRSLVGFALCLVVFIGSLRLIRQNWQQMAVTIPVSISVLYIPLTVFSSVSFVTLAIHALETLGIIRSGSETGE
jgi:TRAP-type C4-dicarboxylate transport system permease small subunit